MTEPSIRFDDGGAYERYMGVWSQRAGVAFLDWIAPRSGLRWLDVGCGNGAFTELLFRRCAPSSVQGLDPSEGQLAFARTRLAPRGARFYQGDAMALPFPDDSFDAAVMPLVIAFVPKPTQGVGEMARVVCPGGTVAAYAWDAGDGGFPYETVHAEMRASGIALPTPPSPDACRLDVMRELWTENGIDDVETRHLSVHRTFADFEDFWTTILAGPSVRPGLSAMTPDDLARFKSRMAAGLGAESKKTITLTARASAVKGRV